MASARDNVASSTKLSEPPITSTIIICTRKRPDLLHRCLAAVRNLDPRPADVLVIDNSEGDGATRQVAQDHGVRYSVEPVQGLSRARNRGIRESHSDLIAFLVSPKSAVVTGAAIPATGRA